MADTVTDEQLLERAADGDEQSFFKLYMRHRDAIFSFLYRLGGSIEAAEDMTQDCFLGLLQKPHKFDGNRAPLRTYLYGAARNHAMKYFRRNGREVTGEEFDTDSIPGDLTDPLGRLLDGELSAQVQKAVSNLPPAQRESLILFEYEGLSLEDIAGVVGADVGTVKSRLHRARRRLRNDLADYFKDQIEMVAGVHER